MVFRMVETSVKISRIIIPLCQQESIEDSHEKAGKNRGKQLTRQEPYNIIMQYDKRRNSEEPKPRSLTDSDKMSMWNVDIYRRETNENLYGKSR